MSDALVRAVHRQYLQGHTPVELFVFLLERNAAHPIWDWIAGGLQFNDLPLERKVAFFLEKWPIETSSLDPERLRTMIENTYRRGAGVYWDHAHPEAPSAGEILDETMNDLAYYYGRRIPPNPWTPSFSNFIATEVENVQYLVAVLQHHGVLPA